MEKKTGGKQKGCAKTGGRQKGTPNADTLKPERKEMKERLRSASIEYFTPHERRHPLTGVKQQLSDFEADMMQLEPNERLNAQLKILEYHTAKMKSVDATIDINVKNDPIEDRLRQLCEEEDDA